MKTTFDLPSDLVRKLKLRAVRDGRKLKDVAAELLSTGLAAAPRPPALPKGKIVRDKKTGFPVIQCPKTPSAHEQATPDLIADILLEQDIEHTHAASRH